jgi:molecular chaperone GrpE
MNLHGIGNTPEGAVCDHNKHVSQYLGYEHNMKKKTQDDQNVGLDSEQDLWKVKYLRALADYQNLEKRTHEHMNESRTNASAYIIRALLPVLDNLKRASVHLADDGLSHIVRQFTAVLEEAGVVKIEVIGKVFDPAEMECVSVMEGKKGIVIEELAAGYRIHGKVLRPAQVKVGKGVTIDDGVDKTVS